MLNVEVSVLIPSYNGCDMLLKCLEAVFKHTRDVSCEVIVIDNGSVDGTEQVVHARFPSIQLVRLPVNQGFVRACNVGAAQARGRYILLLSNDVFIENNFIKILSDFLTAHPRCGAAGGALTIVSTGKPESSYGSYPSLSEALADALFLPILVPGLCTKARFGRVDGVEQPFTADYVTGADLMVRRELLREGAVFDERFWAYYEDVDLCRHVWDSDFEVWVVPAAHGTHMGSATYGREPESKIKLQCAGIGKFLRKYHRSPYVRLAQGLYAWTRLIKIIVRFFQFRICFWNSSTRRYYREDCWIHCTFLLGTMSKDGWQ